MPTEKPRLRRINKRLEIDGFRASRWSCASRAHSNSQTLIHTLAQRTGLVENSGERRTAKRKAKLFHNWATRKIRRSVARVLATDSRRPTWRRYTPLIIRCDINTRV